MKGCNKTWLVSEIIANDAVNALCRAAQSNLSQGTNASGYALEAAYGIVNGPSVDLSPQDVQERLEMPAAPVAKSDQRPLLTPETVDAIDPKVCEAVFDAWRHAKPTCSGYKTNADAGRAMIRAVAAHCRVPQLSGNPGELETAEADWIIDRGIKSEHYDTMMEVLRTLRSRLTLKPRRLTDEEALELSEFADSRVPAEAVAGHSIAREVARLWGMKVPAERPARALSDNDAFELTRLARQTTGPNWTVAGHAIYAEALRLAGKPVEPAPVAAVELSEDEVTAFNDAMNMANAEAVTHDRAWSTTLYVAKKALSRILAARKAKDVADMRPPFEGPKHGFAAPDEANANVNGLTGEGVAP